MKFQANWYKTSEIFSFQSDLIKQESCKLLKVLKLFYCIHTKIYVPKPTDKVSVLSTNLVSTNLVTPRPETA